MNRNTLKIIAALSMLIDHVGIMFFPNITLFRIIGRLSFPIFAFMIAEGCKYTKNKSKYFLIIFVLGTLCQIVYYLYDKSLDMSILITFSLSILMIYSLDYLKNCIYRKSKVLLSILLFISSILGVYLLNKCFIIDYGFIGCVTPLFASLLVSPKGYKLDSDKNYIHVILITIPLIMLLFTMEDYQIYSLLSIVLLLLYNGKNSKLNLKYFFYIFYPLHLVVLECIRLFI